MIDLKTITKEDFDPHINSNFRLKMDQSRDIDFQLVETSSSSSENIDAFKILFKGPVDTIYPQRIYKLEHGAMGDMEIFIVPIKKDDTGVYYESVFSRLINKD